jgi:hypothetical protein
MTRQDIETNTGTPSQVPCAKNICLVRFHDRGRTERSVAATTKNFLGERFICDFTSFIWRIHCMDGLNPSIFSADALSCRMQGLLSSGHLGSQ